MPRRCEQEARVQIPAFVQVLICASAYINFHRHICVNHSMGKDIPLLFFIHCTKLMNCFLWPFPLVSKYLVTSVVKKKYVKLGRISYARCLFDHPVDGKTKFDEVV